MNELVQLVQQKTGLSQEVAEKVVDTVVGFIKQKLPAPLASGLDSMLAGENTQAAGAAAGADPGLMSKAGEMLSGMFGKKEG